MNFNLFQLFQNPSVTLDTSYKNPEHMISEEDLQKQNKLLQEIQNMKPGQTIHGEVVEVNGNEVKISIKDAYLTAKLERSLAIAVGQSLTFEVQSNSQNQISLRPLFENMTQDINVLKALEAAKLPANQTTTQLVSALMKEGMPINRETLQNLYKQMLANKGSDMQSVIQLNRLQIPVTEENLEQFKLYKNYEHRVVKGIETIMDEIPKAMRQFTDLSTNPQSMEAIRKIFSGLLENTFPKESVHLKNSTAMINGESNSLGNEKAQQILSETATLHNPELLGNSETTNKETLVGDKVILNGRDLPNSITASSNPEMLLQGIAKPEESGSPFNLLLGQQFTQDERASLIKELEPLNPDKAMTAAIQNGSATAKEVLEFIRTMFTKENFSSKEEIGKFMGSKSFGELLKAQLQEQWLLKPEDISQKDSINKFYQRLQAQTEQLAENLSGLKEISPALSKTVNQLQGNMDFMNQLNQLVTYIQLPLKMNHNNAHGELYVFTNKKNLAKKDGNVSALLHLDMEHLGSTDIYVTMERQNVTTKFYLSSESIIELVEKHLPMFEGRLVDKGYQIRSELLKRVQEVNVMEEILDSNKNAGIMSKYAFDVRA